MLELKNIKKNKEYIKKARALYNSAFPSANVFRLIFCFIKQRAVT